MPDPTPPDQPSGQAPGPDRPDRQPPPQGKEQKPEQEKKRSRWPLIILGIVVVVALVAWLIYWLSTKDQISTDDAFTDGRAAMIAPQVSGQVVALLIGDNQFVHKGDPLIEIDPRQYQAAVAQAEGQLRTIEAQLADAKVALAKSRVSAPAQLLAAEGQLGEAKAQRTQAEAEYRRQHRVDRAATSEQNIDKANAGLQQADGQVKQATAQLREASLVEETLAQAAARVAQLEGQQEQAGANLAQARLNLSYTHLTAPADGWITKRNVELGSFAQTGVAIAALVAPEVWVTANFKETQLDRMRPGQRVKVAIDAFPSLRLSGHVDSIQLGSGSRFSAFPAENATGNFIKIVQRVPVKIVIDSGIDPARPLPLGMSVVPTVYFE